MKYFCFALFSMLLTACDSPNVMYDEIVTLQKGTSQKAYKFEVERLRSVDLEIEANPNPVNAFIVEQDNVEKFFKLESFNYVAPFEMKDVIRKQKNGALKKGQYALIIGQSDLNQANSTNVTVKLTFTNP